MLQTFRTNTSHSGITRQAVIEMVILDFETLGLKGPPVVRNISLSEFHAADEVFTTGSMGEVTPVVEIDGRTIGSGAVGEITRALQRAYSKLTESGGYCLPTQGARK